MSDEYPTDLVQFVILQLRSGSSTADLMVSDIPNDLVSHAVAAKIREDVTGEAYDEW